MELKWTLFKDELPSCRCCYLTNFETTWVRECIFGDFNREWKQHQINWPEYAWSEIPLPEVPKKLKIRHKCENNDPSIFSLPRECKELEDGLYILTATATGKMGYFRVKFCPFCGFKPEND